jgi:bacterial/archaeal transporter family-2 protein
MSQRKGVRSRPAGQGTVVPYANVLAALVVGQLTLAVIIDHFGLLGVPRSALSVTRLLGVAVLALGALLIVRK